jgi:hypothetical protein
VIVNCDRATWSAALADDHEAQALLARGIYGLMAYPPRLDGRDPHRAARVAFEQKLRALAAAHYNCNRQAVGRLDRVKRAGNIGLKRVADAVLVGVMAGQLAKAHDDGRHTSIASTIAQFRKAMGEPLTTAQAPKNAHARLWRRYLPVAHLGYAVAREWKDAPEGGEHTRLLLHPDWCTRALVNADRWFRPAIEEALDVELLPLLPARKETFRF